MKKLATLILAAAFLCGIGCAKKIVWNKPGLTQEEFARDNAQCQFEAKKNTRPMGAFDNPMLWGLQTGSQERDLYILCMQSKGYYSDSQ